MRTLIRNLILFADGFRRLDTLTFKKGWNVWTFGLLYLIDYGTHVLTGAAVVSWSRWFYEHRRTNRVAAFMNRLLEHIDRNHGEETGPALWGSVDCSKPVRIALFAFWAVLLWSLL